MKSGRKLQKNPEEIPKKVLETIKCLFSVPDVKSTLAHTIYYSSYILLQILPYHPHTEKHKSKRAESQRFALVFSRKVQKTRHISHSNRWEIMVKFPQTHTKLGPCCLAIHKENMIQSFSGSQDFTSVKAQFDSLNGFSVIAVYVS